MDETIAEFVRQVRKNARYADIDEKLVTRLVQDFQSKGFSPKDIVKRTRAKLHQIGGAYQENAIPYQRLHTELLTLPDNLQDAQVLDFCTRVIDYHRSTKERAAQLSVMYKAIFADLPPIHAILDLACGLNPLTLPWMPVADTIQYHACDIYGDMITLLNDFFAHFHVNGRAFLCDLSTEVPTTKVDLVFLFKTLPCLEQVDKSISLRLLQSISSEYVLVSFPVRSLSGRAKGMPQHYEQHFQTLLAQTDWHNRPYNFTDETFFLLYK
jgi:16S rRNA (guanine(1405)-N(7))-methyltransferase